MRPRVQLTATDLRKVAYYAAKIREYRAGREDRFTVDGHDKTSKEVVGRVGEYAVAKYLGVEYPFRIEGDIDGDVAGYQVRTRSRHFYDLPTYDWDTDGTYILATWDPRSSDGIVILHGWASLAETRQSQRWAADLPFPCYLTRQKDLNPMSTLPEAIHD